MGGIDLAATAENDGDGLSLQLSVVDLTARDFFGALMVEFCRKVSDFGIHRRDDACSVGHTDPLHGP